MRGTRRQTHEADARVVDLTFVKMLNAFARSSNDGPVLAAHDSNHSSRQRADYRNIGQDRSALTFLPAASHMPASAAEHVEIVSKRNAERRKEQAPAAALPEAAAEAATAAALGSIATARVAVM
jgi:hypothetical protein